MIISRAGNHSTICADYCGYDYAVYGNAAGWIVARIKDGFSTFMQPGDSANSFEAELTTACNLCETGVDPEAVEDCQMQEIDRIAASYDVGDSFISPSEAGGAPSSDGMFWGFYHAR